MACNPPHAVLYLLLETNLAGLAAELRYCALREQERGHAVLCSKHDNSEMADREKDQEVFEAVALQDRVFETPE